MAQGNGLAGRDDVTPVPTRTVGPVRLAGPEAEGEFLVPLATYETPLWATVERGAAVTARAGGIRAVVTDDRMARSVLLEATDAAAAHHLIRAILARRETLAKVMAATSRFVRLLDLHWQVVGNLMYLRFELATGDAAGHNMATLAADAALRWLQDEYPSAHYVSISGNYCTDKKVSAVNGILGRGKSVVADVLVPEKLCRRYLKTTPAELVALHVRKNLIGSILAGSVRSANAHFANMLLGVYLATGQDAANIVEGSQGVVHAETRGPDLYFSCSLPNLIVGTVGSGKEHPVVRARLEQLGCRAAREPGANARRLAVVVAATVLCGELSLLAAQTNPGELSRAHLRLERGGEPPP